MDSLTLPHTFALFCSCSYPSVDDWTTLCVVFSRFFSRFFFSSLLIHTHVVYYALMCMFSIKFYTWSNRTISPRARAPQPPTHTFSCHWTHIRQLSTNSFFQFFIKFCASATASLRHIHAPPHTLCVILAHTRARSSFGSHSACLSTL